MAFGISVTSHATTEICSAKRLPRPWRARGGARRSGPRLHLASARPGPNADGVSRCSACSAHDLRPLRNPTMLMPRVLAFVVREFKEMIPPTLFFAVGFNLIVLTTQLILDDYRLQFLNFMIATTAALVVGKSVLLANALPFLRRFDRAPLIQPILFKAAVY